jgi:hypothetical protein
LFECDSTEKKHSKAVRYAGVLIKDVSGINREEANMRQPALKIISWPEEAAGNFL